MIVESEVLKVTFSNFLCLIYGNRVEVDYSELLNIYNFSQAVNYSKSNFLKNVFFRKISSIPYSESDNKLYIIISLLNNRDFSKEDILKNCKLSQLKRIKTMIEKVDILRRIM